MKPFYHSCRRPAAMLMLLVVLAILRTGLSLGQTITVGPVITAPLNTLTFADIDLQNATSPKYLFTVPINAGGATVQVTMHVTLSITLASGEQLGNPYAAELVTDPFTIKGSLVFTNLDLGKGRLISVATFTFDQTARKRLEDLALPSGQLPAGSYHFSIDVTPVTGSSGNTQFTIILTNPSSVDLVFPVDGDPSVSPLPLFQWRYDGSKSRISVFEKLEGQYSLEETAGGTPMLQMEISRNSFQYPSAGARSLVPGKTYIWFVEGLSAVTGGVSIPIRSELRSFSVASAGTPSFLSYLDDLERILDPKYKPVFDQIRAEGLQATGRIKLNGSAISTVELLKIIRQLRDNPDGVLTVGLDQ